MRFNSRRSPVYGTHGMVATSQPLASMAGIRILQDGGNAADAAVATAAALNVTEPTGTGIGGDCFCLFYDAAERKVKALNASGRAPAGLSVEYLADRGVTELPRYSVHTVTVPGAAAGWVDTVERFALSIGMSLALVPLMGLLLNYAPWGIQPTSVTASLLAFTFTFATAAVIREFQAKTSFT